MQVIPSYDHEKQNPKAKRVNYVADEYDWKDLLHDPLVLIFSFLAARDRFRAGKVCKTWYRASWDPGCWTQSVIPYDCLGCRHQHQREIINVVERIHAPLDRIRLNQIAARDVVTRGQGKLIDLSVNFCDIATLEFIAKNCPLLERLKVTSSRLDSRWMQAVDAIATGCRSLSDLEIWMWISPLHVAEFTGKLAPRLPKLTSLALSNTQITDDLLSATADGLPDLQALTLQLEQCITDASLGVIARKLKRLKTLEMKLCGSVTTGGVKSLRSQRHDLDVEVLMC
ncbi:hypothetical protein CBR_g47147 [Chara braunii]|uniref:F-box domain-containing protein n=1 Tax=Chara braunii TaxID=69332 RepID=A0A388M1I4_CHABU|nr:hypothetical protein CBR_g47147 [Chara braunii]|eukprot:GBG88447.1 hypothetical protein CBR_g47147 [Chara braunii]